MRQYDRKEAAAYLRTTPARLESLARRKQGPECTKIDGKWLYRQDALDAFANEGAKKGRHPHAAAAFDRRRARLAILDRLSHTWGAGTLSGGLKLTLRELDRLLREGPPDDLVGILAAPQPFQSTFPGIEPKVLSDGSLAFSVFIGGGGGSWVDVVYDSMTGAIASSTGDAPAAHGPVSLAAYIFGLRQGRKVGLPEAAEHLLGCYGQAMLLALPCGAEQS